MSPPVLNRIIFSGSRNLGSWDKPFLQRKMEPFFHLDSTLVHGDALGGDTRADEIWTEWGGRTEKHPVTPEDWEQYGKKAGHRRNGIMVDLGADLWMGFPIGDRKQSPGTWGCRDLARAAGMPCEWFPYEPRVFDWMKKPTELTEDW